MNDESDNKLNPPLRLVQGGRPLRRKSSVEELVESGLLQEINRRILHPFGFAMSVEVDEDDHVEGFVIEDRRDTPEECLFTPAYLEEARKQLKKFLHEEGEERLARRRRVLGWEIQGKDELQLED